MDEANWLLTVNEEGVRIRRLVDVDQAASPGPGKIGMLTAIAVEHYRTVKHAEGAVWAAAVSQGYEPPRGLVKVEAATKWDPVKANLRSVPISELIADELPDQ
jgi:hypothetical protein